MSYQIRRVDDNQAEIVKTLRKNGARVAVLSSMGNGIPDLVCSINGELLFIEIKSSAKAKLTTQEQKFYDLWKDHVLVIHSKEQALELFIE